MTIPVEQPVHKPAGLPDWLDPDLHGAVPKYDVWATVVGDGRLPTVFGADRAALDRYYRQRRRYYEMAGNVGRYEFVNGEIIVHAPVTASHDRAAMVLNSMLGIPAIRLGLGWVSKDFLMTAMTGNIYEPDVWFYETSRWDVFGDSRFELPPPDFIAEVVSPESEALDRGVKFEDYAVHGVREYWIVDPQAETVEQYVLEAERYVLRPKVQGDRLTSETVPGVRVRVPALFGKLKY